MTDYPLTTWDDNWDLDEWTKVNGLLSSAGLPVSMIFADVETTGLGESVKKDHILEVGMAATDVNGGVIDVWSSFVLGEGWLDAISTMDTVVFKMHVDNSLLKQYEEAQHGEVFAGYNEADMRPDMVVDRAWAWLQDLEVEQESQPMCGNNVPFDRTFIMQDLPALTDFFHYRNIDVSSTKELCRRYNPRVYEGKDAMQLGYDHLPKHRVLYDMAASIREHLFYVDNFLFVEL